MKEVEDMITSNRTSTDNKISGKTDFSNLISELTKIKNEGNSLYKEKKLDEAKKKYEEGLEKYGKESSLINKEKGNNDQCNEVLLLHKKILSNLALCYYKQENYEKAIEYDLEIIAENPKYGKSIVRLFNSYSRINKIAQAVYYGDLFLELEQETKDKFKDIQNKIQDEKQKLKTIQKQEKEKIKKEFIKYGVSALILFLAVLIFLFFRKK